MTTLEELKGEILGVLTVVGGDAVALGGLSAGLEQTILATSSSLLGIGILVVATLRHKTNTTAKK